MTYLEIKELMRKSQREYISQHRKHSPNCDWTDQEITDSHHPGNLITLKYCYGLPLTIAKKILAELDKEK